MRPDDVDFTGLKQSCHAQAPCIHTSSWHSGHAYTIRRSASNDTKPPSDRSSHDGQIAPATSTVEIRNARPVAGSGKLEGAAECRVSRDRPSLVVQTNTPPYAEGITLSHVGACLYHATARST